MCAHARACVHVGVGFAKEKMVEEIEKEEMLEAGLFLFSKLGWQWLSQKTLNNQVQSKRRHLEGKRGTFFFYFPISFLKFEIGKLL